VTGTCIGARWTVKLSFSYQNTATTGAVQIAGFNAGGIWDPADGTITNGTLLTPVTTNVTPTDTGEWRTYQTSVTLTQDFVALGVGFNLQAVDNVVVEVVAP
jgi:hypothetical protein